MSVLMILAGGALTFSQVFTYRPWPVLFAAGFTVMFAGLVRVIDRKGWL